MSRRTHIWMMLALCIVSQSMVGCAQFLSNLRQDLEEREVYDSGPTVGGNWTERGYLSESEATQDRGRRGLASLRNAGESGRNSWTAGRADLRRRGTSLAEDVEGEESGIISPGRPSAVKSMYKYGNRATREDFIDQAPNEGSLWASDGQTNYYFTKNKIRGEGDIITITMEEGLVKDAMRELTRTLTPQEREKELQLAQDRLMGRYLAQQARGKAGVAGDAVSTSAAAAGRAPAGVENKEGEENYSVFGDSGEPKATQADIDVSKSADLKVGETMMGEILERYPNGNYKIRASKKIGYRQGDRMIELIAIVRGADITEQDTLTSGKFYEYRVAVAR